MAAALLVVVPLVLQAGHRGPLEVSGLGAAGDDPDLDTAAKRAQQRVLDAAWGLMLVRLLHKDVLVEGEKNVLMGDGEIFCTMYCCESGGNLLCEDHHIVRLGWGFWRIISWGKKGVGEKTYLSVAEGLMRPGAGDQARKPSVTW